MKKNFLMLILPLVLLAGCGETPTTSQTVQPTQPTSDPTTVQPTTTVEPTSEVTTEEKPSYPTTSEEAPEAAFLVTFIPDEHVKVLVYAGNDYDNLTPAYADHTYTRAKDAPFDYSNDIEQCQVNFMLEIEEGYEVEAFDTDSDSFDNFKLPADTGKENVYKITKVLADLEIGIVTKKVEDDFDAWKVTFVPEHCKVLVLPNDDYESQAVETNETFALNQFTWNPSKVCGPQVNFYVVPEEGYTIADSCFSIDPEDGFKNLKDRREKKENAWRITKVKKDITVTITAIAG